MNTHRLATETPRRAACPGAVPDWAGLLPAGAAVLGPPSQPVERLIGTQAAVYRFMVMLGDLQLRRRHEPASQAAPARG